MTDVMRQASQEGSGTGRHLRVVSEPEPTLSSANNAEDFFYDPNVVPARFHYDTTVVERRDFKEPVRYREGTMFYETYTMSDGIYHHVLTGRPHDQKTDIPIDIDTAWWTDAEGHNEHTALKFMEMGIPVRVVGSERIRVNEWRGPISVIRGLRQAFSIELAHSAHNTLEILRVNDEANKYLIRRGVSMHYGESRDAMMEPGLQLLAANHVDPELNRDIVYADEVDPCCPEPINLSPDELDWEKCVAEGKAIWTAGKRIIRSPLRRHYPRTIDLSPNSLVPQFATGRTLVSGQAGELAELSPDRRRTITLYLSSIANKANILKEIYVGHENTTIIDLAGAHLSIPDVLPFVISRYDLVLDELMKKGDDPSQIDFERVYAESLQAA